MNKEEFYKSLLDNIGDGIYFVDVNRKNTFWNKGAERISGFSSKEVVNSFCYDNILNHVDDKGTELCHNGCPLHKTLKDGNFREAIVFLHHKYGQRVPIKIKVAPIIEEGKIIGAVEVFNKDVKDEEILKSIEEYKKLALHDQLTGLPNRRYIDSFLDSKIKEYKSLGVPFGVAFIDIDKLKVFNDTYGHDVGDEVLKMLSKVFIEVTRTSDLVGRWGGEEFIGIFVGINKADLYKISEKIRMLAEKSSLREKDEELKVTISIGATLVSKEDTIEKIVKRADELLYESKLSGRNRVTIG